MYKNNRRMKKKFFVYMVAVMVASACSSNQPEECIIPKNSVELAGNAFSSFSLGGDAKLHAVQNPADDSQWTIQAVIPVRKEIKTPIKELSIDIVPLDDNGVRVRDGLVLQGEDLANLLPVYNAGENVERVIVFSIPENEKKYLSDSEVAQLLEKTKKLRMNFNVSSSAGSASEKTAATITETEAPTDYPMTIDGLCRKYGIYGMLSQYDRALRNGNKSRAKKIEDQLWAIEKRVKANRSIPERVRDGFVHYIEEKEDIIEDRY